MAILTLTGGGYREFWFRLSIVTFLSVNAF